MKRLRADIKRVLCKAGMLTFISTGSALAADWNWTTLHNPYWEIDLSNAGYSDYLFDQTPGFVGREYLSGEWGAAIGYTKATQTVSPTWLEQNFSYPDWQTNSNYSVESPIAITNYGADGSGLAAKSTLANADLKIEQTYRLVDTITGTAMGLSAASLGGSGSSLMSNRYVLMQEYSITNTSGETIDNLQLFQLLHGLNSQEGVYDNRSYAGAFADYRYDITLNGIDGGGAGQKDYIGFSSTLAPSAFELGLYGTFAADDHSIGKPSVGTHLSIEDNNLSNSDSVASNDAWIAGAERWDLGTLGVGETKSLGVMLSILTGWQVDNSVDTGSGNGGSIEIGGVDYEFEGSHSDGQFFFEYSQEDIDSINQLIAAGEFGDLSFTQAGEKLQLFEVDFQGEFEGLLKLTFGYDANVLAGLDESLLRVYHWSRDRGLWENLGGVIDANNHTITVYTDSLSPFAVAAVPLPGAAWLFGSALLGLAGLRKRKYI